MEADPVSNKLNLYEEELNDETTLDLSSQNLSSIPDLNRNKYLCALYLQNNNLTTLPEDLFPSLPALMWLDVRDNQLTDIPTSVKQHPCLTHLLLQNNKLTSLPNELGTLPNLKVLQLGGNPLMYPPRELIQSGVRKLLSFLENKYFDGLFEQSEVGNANSIDEPQSYSSVIDEGKLALLPNQGKTLTIQVSGKEIEDSSDDEEHITKRKKNCPKLNKSRFKNMPTYYQSSKYVKPVHADGKSQIEKIKQNFLREKALKKHIDLVNMQEKILQEKKNMEQLKNWRQMYRTTQIFTNPDYQLKPETFPYDTNPAYMTLLSREDIEKDLPDKYRKKLVRRCKPTVPRKGASDVHLAMKIKKLFENLEAMDKQREEMTPRTEQKVLLGEIQKISEIKQKLMELSVSNTRSVTAE
ncbi:unnamed protein product [Plutella xylostella]|uniref:(diamondback moth) hypothetical protein n=1 Tax=Plutella xylostella TaxID=51655 RepID=A0A8S4ETL6_PLUXY|nr:unnamed protein product [Plutella xylostella]